MQERPGRLCLACLGRVELPTLVSLGCLEILAGLLQVLPIFLWLGVEDYWNYCFSVLHRYSVDALAC